MPTNRSQSGTRRVTGVLLLVMMTASFLAGWLVYPMLSWSGITYSLGLDPLASHLSPPAPGECQQLPSDAYLDLKIQPNRRIDGVLQVQVYAGRPNGSLRLLPVQAIPGPYGGGVFRIKRPLRELSELTPGRWDIVVVLGRAHFMPSPKKVAELVSSGQGRGLFWLLMRTQIEILHAR